MLKKVLFPGLLVACFTFALVPAWAGDEPTASTTDVVQSGPGRGSNGDGPLAKLDLSAEQQAAIRNIHESARTSLQPMREEVQKGRESMRTAMRSDNVDPAEVRRLAHEQADKQVDLRLAQQQTRQQVNAQLTQEQQQEMSRLREQRHERRQEQMGSGSGRGQGMMGGSGGSRAGHR